MKTKLSYLIYIFVIAYGCSKNKDLNNNEIKEPIGVDNKMYDYSKYNFTINNSRTPLSVDEIDRIVDEIKIKGYDDKKINMMLISTDGAVEAVLKEKGSSYGEALRFVKSENGWSFSSSSNIVF